MLAALELVDGSVGTPALSFDNDTDCGLYRIGANNVGVAVAGAKVLDVSTTGLGVTGTLTLTGAVTSALTASAGITATQSTTNGNGATLTGNGTGSGSNATGGTTDGRGGSFFGGGTNGNGAAGTGAGTGYGVLGVGGATGTGVKGQAGGSPTADTNTRYAFEAVSGHVKLSGGNPTSTTAFTNTETPTNLVKVAAKIGFNTTTGTVAGGFNVASASIQSSSVVRITFASAFANTDYVWQAIVSLGVGDFSAPCIPYESARNASYLELTFYTLAGAQVTSINTTGTFGLCFLAMGAQ
jgi:hypothetical protein